MKEYHITLAQTVRIDKTFSAENDEEAIEKAKLMYLEADSSEFEHGQGLVEYDYALGCDDGRVLVYWD